MDASGRKTFQSIMGTLSRRKEAIAVALVVLLFVGARTFSDTLEAVYRGSDVDAIMTLIMTAVVVGGGIGLVFFFRSYLSYFSTHDYDPPFGTAPTMQEHYDSYYLSVLITRWTVTAALDRPVLSIARCPEGGP